MRIRKAEIGYEDIRLVATIAQATTMRRAQAATGLHLATLYRRLRALESEVGGPLFEPRDNVLIPTARAQPFLEAADVLADRLADVQRRVAAQDARLVGPLRVTTADSLLSTLCACSLDFQRAYPDIRLSLDIDNSSADLARREADVAIRPTTAPPETLMGRRAAQFDYAVYKAPRQSTGGWIVLEGEVAAIPSARWLRETITDDAVRLRVNSLTAAASAAANGWGQAVLPAYLATDHALERVGDPIPALTSELWVLFHPDLRTNPRVRAFTEFAANWLRKRFAGT